MYELFPRILAAVGAGDRIALATVVGRKGSLPMAEDAKLLVLADGTLLGTVGGGCLEAEIYGVARRLLRDGGASLDEFHLNEVEASTGGHVCGGTVVVLTRVFEPDASTRAFFELATQQHDGKAAIAFASRLEAPKAAHALVVDGRVIASLGGAPGGDIEATVACLAKGATLADAWFYEAVVARPLLIVFGAGHCGAAIGAAAAAAGYRVWMLEDRPAFLDAERMPWADRLQVVDFAALPVLPLTAETALTIVTRGHDHDLVVLRQVLDAPVSYLGMIGSRRKRALFREILAAEGRDLDAFARVRSPMGMAIGAQTPAEIGAAVTAELIAARRLGDPVGKPQVPAQASARSKATAEA